MIARWDTLFVAAVLSCGSMLIEHSHRIDTALADDTPAVPANSCADTSDLTPGTEGDSGVQVSGVQVSLSAADDDAVVSPACD